MMLPSYYKTDMRLNLIHFWNMYFLNYKFQRYLLSGQEVIDLNSKNMFFIRAARKIRSQGEVATNLQKFED